MARSVNVKRQVKQFVSPCIPQSQSHSIISCQVINHGKHVRQQILHCVHSVIEIIKALSTITSKHNKKQAANDNIIISRQLILHCQTPLEMPISNKLG